MNLFPNHLFQRSFEGTEIGKSTTGVVGSQIDVTNFKTIHFRVTGTYTYLQLVVRGNKIDNTATYMNYLKVYDIQTNDYVLTQLANSAFKTYGNVVSENGFYAIDVSGFKYVEFYILAISSGSVTIKPWLSSDLINETTIHKPNRLSEVVFDSANIGVPYRAFKNNGFKTIKIEVLRTDTSTNFDLRLRGSMQNNITGTLGLNYDELKIYNESGELLSPFNYIISQIHLTLASNLRGIFYVDIKGFWLLQWHMVTLTSLKNVTINSHFLNHTINELFPSQINFPTQDLSSHLMGKNISDNTFKNLSSITDVNGKEVLRVTETSPAAYNSENDSLQTTVIYPESEILTYEITPTLANTFVDLSIDFSKYKRIDLYCFSSIKNSSAVLIQYSLRIRHTGSYTSYIYRNGAWEEQIFTPANGFGGLYSLNTFYPNLNTLIPSETIISVKTVSEVPASGSLFLRVVAEPLNII